jgi:hypothetical protein
MSCNLASKAGAALVLTILAATPAAAQIDYRNLDDDRPTRVEDAYPAERYAFELLMAYSFERERAGASVHAALLELEYGIIPNGHVGLKAPLAAVRDAGTTEWGLSGLRAFALYNFNTEGPFLPALSVRADATLPAGSLGGDRVEVGVQGIVTRSFGRSRLHLNGAVRLTRDAPGAVVESLDRWWLGAALDRTLFRQSLLVIGEIYARHAVAGTPVEVNAGLGLRWQWRPTAVIDLGVSRRLRRDAGPDYAVTLGISNAFAIAGLLPRGR